MRFRYNPREIVYALPFLTKDRITLNPTTPITKVG